MIATVHKGGASFKGVVDYCLSEGRAREDERDELRGEDRGQDKAGRVAWSETRNVAAEDPRHAARVMAATASRSEELKELAGVKAGGRALEKPVCHYSLSWAKDENPGLKEMGQAVTESLEKMGLADRQAVMIAHRDTAQPHVHVVVNRVSVEDGRAAKLGNSYLKLSRWAEGYEREQGRIRCPQRVENNAGRDRGEWVRCASMKPGRYRRGPGRESKIRRRHIPAGRNTARDEAASLGRRQFVRNLEQGQRQQWGQLYRRHEQERRQLSQDWGSLQGRVRQWQAQGKHWDELAGAVRGKSQVRGEWEQGMDRGHRRERAELVRDHGLESRRVEQEWAAVDRQREQEAARGQDAMMRQSQEAAEAAMREAAEKKAAAEKAKIARSAEDEARPKEIYDRTRAALDKRLEQVGRAIRAGAEAVGRAGRDLGRAGRAVAGGHEAIRTAIRDASEGPVSAVAHAVKQIRKGRPIVRGASEEGARTTRSIGVSYRRIGWAVGASREFDQSLQRSSGEFERLVALTRAEADQKRKAGNQEGRVEGPIESLLQEKKREYLRREAEEELRYNAGRNAFIRSLDPSTAAIQSWREREIGQDWKERNPQDAQQIQQAVAQERTRDHGPTKDYGPSLDR